MATEVLSCPLCAEFHAPTIQLLIPHIRLVHSNQPGFCVTCGLDGCQRTFRNMKTFTNHMYQFHMISRTVAIPHQLPSSMDREGESESLDEDGYESPEENALLEPPSTSESDLLPNTLEKELQSYAATWILKTREVYKLTQSAVNNIIQDVTALAQFLQDKARIAVEEALKNAGVASSQIPDLQTVFNPEGPFGRPFRGLESTYQQTKYCREHFGLVEPRSVVLGTERQWNGVGEKRRYETVEEKMMYIPVLETLGTLLGDEMIMAEVSKRRQSPAGVVADYCDGQAYKEHRLYQHHSTGLRLILYYDDVEVCNPLGSKRKIHKLGIFYFLLGNLPPWMRSKINSVQLVMLVKKTLIDKYTMQSVLKPIVEDLKKLEMGHELVLRRGNSVVGVPVIYGTIFAVSADNPASCSLGGFKEGGSAFRFCRQCLTKYEEIKMKAHEDQCTLRTPEDHNRQCTELEDNSALSKEFGINSCSILNELEFFHVASGALLPDIMHDILEGALAYESKIMLQRFIQQERYFKLADLNYKLENFQFGYTEVTNRPTLIAHTTITGDDNSLKQNASQSWLLGRYLPLMIGDMVPEGDEHWMCYTLLLRIMQYLFAPKLTEDDLAILQEMIMDHHHRFVSLYPNRSIIPKQHYLIHTPRLFYQFGPLVHHWTMRFEGKHKYFKRLASAIGNFINLPYTLAMRHQFLQCYLRLESPGSLTTIEVGKGVDMTTCGLPHLVHLQGNQIYCPKWIEAKGVTYKRGCVMTLRLQHSLEDYPVFGAVEDVYVVNSIHVYLYVKLFDTVDYSDHFGSYIVRPTESRELIALENFLSYLPLHKHKIPSFPTSFFVVPKFRVC